jgi:hypothetical protein
VLDVAFAYTRFLIHIRVKWRKDMRSTRLANEKQQILESKGYRYSFDRQIYFNRDAKKAFSVEFIEDHPADELERLIRENPRSTDWAFFFNERPSDAVKRELVNVLG